MKNWKHRMYIKGDETEVDRRKKKRREVEGILLKCKDER